MAKEPQIGFHVSIADSLELAYDRASELGCTTFQLFTRNPRVWKFKPLQESQIDAFLSKRKNTGFRHIVAHMPYLPNLASPQGAIMRKSRFVLEQEVGRCDELQIDYLVVHLGSHMGKGTMVGVRDVAEACRMALEKSAGKTTILLENMAGQKNCVGARFEELRMILDRIDDPKRAGVCFDTCHAFAAGFDLRSSENVETTMGLFDELVGMDELQIVHLNDSKGPLGGALDRHEHIGMGEIGKEGFRAFLGYKEILDGPVIMETPIDDLRGQKEDMSFVRRLLPSQKNS